MEKLDEYLKGRKAYVFAEQIGKSPSFVCELRKGTRMPSLATMRAIHDATGGAITLADWMDATDRAGAP